MARVIAEQTFPDPLSDERYEVFATKLAPCLEVRNGAWRRSSISLDRARMVCEFEAPDAESVREAFRNAGIPFDRIYGATVNAVEDYPPLLAKLNAVAKKIAIVPLVAAALATSAFTVGCKSGDCVYGAYKDPDSGVCLRLGSDLKAQKLFVSGQDSHLTVSKPNSISELQVWIEPPDDLAKRAHAVEAMATNNLKLLEKGDTETNGKFFRFHNNASKEDFVEALVAGKQHFYRCQVAAPPDAITPFLDACKTVAGP